MAGVVTVEMLNGQAVNLPVADRNALGAPPKDPWNDSGDTWNFAPWREPVIPPGHYPTERARPTPGEIHVAPDAYGMRVPEKPVTPSHNPRMFPREGDLSYEAERPPTASYRTRAEAFKNVDYSSVKPIIGPLQWPSRKLFPGLPTQEKVDSIEHDVLPVPGTAQAKGEATVVDIPELDQSHDLWQKDAEGDIFLAGLGHEEDEGDNIGLDGLGQITASLTLATQKAIQPEVTAIKADPTKTEQEKSSSIASLITQASQFATQAYQAYLVKRAAERAAKKGVPPPTTPGVPEPGVPKPPVEEKPWYTSPAFLIGAPLALLAGGYLLLKK